MVTLVDDYCTRGAVCLCEGGHTYESSLGSLGRVALYNLVFDFVRRFHLSTQVHTFRSSDHAILHQLRNQVRHDLTVQAFLVVSKGATLLLVGSTVRRYQLATSELSGLSCRHCDLESQGQTHD